jgi:hypothetical protein
MVFVKIRSNGLERDNHAFLPASAWAVKEATRDPCS